MLRYHKKVYFPINSDNILKKFTDYLNALNFKYTSHCINNIKNRIYNIHDLLYFIKNLKLDYKNIFEFYIENNIIEKACYRIKYQNNIDIILILSKFKDIITIYINSDNDTHVTLKHELYNKA